MDVNRRSTALRSQKPTSHRDVRFSDTLIQARDTTLFSLRFWILGGSVFAFLAGFGLTSLLLSRDSTVQEPQVLRAIQNVSAQDVSTTSLLDDDLGEPEAPFLVASGGDFTEHFSGDFSLEQASEERLSDSPEWWLQSGAFLYRQNDTGQTVQGLLTEGSPWIDTYNAQNARATDGGRLPQNFFRLIKRGAWRDMTQEVYFSVGSYNAVDAPARNASNGLHLFMRYADQDNHYYGGLQVDGNVVIMRKEDGQYHVLATSRYIDGLYDRRADTSLIPQGELIGIKTEINDLPDGTVRIRVYIDEGRTYSWALALEFVDDGAVYSGSVIGEEGRAGIRTDFMDVTFDHYRVAPL